MDILSRQQTPAFTAFKTFANEAVAANPGLIPLDCLNPVKSLKPEFDFSDPPTIPLTEAWRNYLAVKGGKAFLTRGVRHSISILFDAYKKRQIAIPSGVYPVYRMIADAAGASCVEYDTQPDGIWLDALCKAEVALVTMPHTPTGHSPGDHTIEMMASWLKANPFRRLIIDRVYDYNNDNSLQPLLDTDQVFVCYSLSKTHLSPLTSGFTFCPSDFMFGGEPGSEEDGDRAKVLLTRYKDYPREQASRFRYRWRMLQHRLPPPLDALEAPVNGYLTVVKMTGEELLAKGILAVPGNVYERCSDYSVLSCLHETNAMGDTEEVERYYVTVASNFARGYDKYTRRYSKKKIAESTFPHKFYVLMPDKLDIGFTKAEKLLKKTKPGDYVVVLKTQMPRHELQPNGERGQFVNRDHIVINGVYDYAMKPLQVEDVYADSMALATGLKPWAEVLPRSMSVLPIAQACQARCEFCFSHSSVSDDQRQGRVVMGVLEEACVKSKALGANRLVITGGGEPTLLAHDRLLELIRTGRKHFTKVVMITNGYVLGNANSAVRAKTMTDYHDAGLTVLSVSRHSPDRNHEIMKIDTQSTKIAITWADLRAAGSLQNMTMRWVCVLQKPGVKDERTLVDYLNWTVATGVPEICFKELYVAVSRESEYYDSKYNVWSRENQVPLSLVTGFVERHGGVLVDQLPWGSPVYELEWTGLDKRVQKIRIAAYTEPSVFWERATGVCRSWNLMADGTCYANLETHESIVRLGGKPIPLSVV